MLLSKLGDKNKKAMDIVIAMGPGKKPFKDREEKGYNEEIVSKERPDTSMDEYNMIADEMMNAFKDGSVEKLAGILKAFASKFEPMGAEMPEEEMEA